MRDLLIFPFNGNAKEALDCVGDNYRVVAFIDDQQSKHGSYRGIPIGGRELLSKIQDGAVLLAVPGSINTYKKLDEIIESFDLKPEHWAQVIHPKASISKSASIGHNVLIMAGTVLTAESRVGNHCCILPNCVIHHDSVINDLCTLAAGSVIAGYVEIGKKCYIGAGCNIKNNVILGDETLVGMGSNVLKTFPGHSTLVGNPARILKS